MKPTETLSNKHQQVILTTDLERDLTMAIAECEHDRIFVIADRNTHAHCMGRLSTFRCLRDVITITIEPSDAHKDLTTLTAVWQQLQEHGATRHSLVICLGGGVVTDLGGMAAATFKRGINFINIPTSLLGMVDASVGGKTGVNFGGLKNEIGVFAEARFVLLCADFLATLDGENLRSGYAEMLKHGLISTTAQWASLLQFDLAAPDYSLLGRLVADSVKVKEDIVAQDPLEQGLRKALNLGHTTGHALESLAMEKGQPVLHGYAVAWGIVCELYLSTALCGFPVERMRQTVQYIRQHYGTPNVTCNDYDHLYALMQHDKKNVGGEINFTLLHDVGRIALDRHASRQLIDEALDFLREG